MSTSVQRFQQQRVRFLLLGVIVTLFSNTVWASATAIGVAVSEEVGVANATNAATRHLQTSQTGFQELLLAAVNKERAAVGLASLCTNTNLQSSAQKHSNDMAAGNFVSHTGSDGSTMSQRVTTAGFKWTTIAENVAAGQKDVAAVMKAWMNSASDKKNILNSSFKFFGAGYAYNADSTYKHYWVQNFGAECTESGAGSIESGVSSSSTMAPATTTPTATANVPAATTTAPVATTQGPSSTMHTQMLASVNKERAAVGLPALCMNTKLQAAAQRHSNDMAAKNFLSHTGSDGSTMAQRITAAGYSWTSIAENVAAGQNGVDAVMISWMNSPVHKANILSSETTMIGVAYANNANSAFGYYWTQDFGAGSSESCSS